MSQHDLPHDEPSEHRTRPNRRDRETNRDGGTRAGHREGDESATLDRAELAAQVELLADENARLRERYASARRTRYRRTALGLATVGLAAVAAGLALPAGRDVLFVLGATGLFSGLLTVVLTPERFVAASVGERVYTALASNHAALVDELGLRSEPRYLPGTAGNGPQVFVPQGTDADTPTAATGPIVPDEGRRGLLLEPTGAGLYTAFVDGTAEALPTVPERLAEGVADAVVEQFELASRVDPDADGDRVTFAVSDAAFGPLDRFDHPIPSFLAVGLAVGLGRPIRLTVYPGDDRADWLVTCWWTDDAESESADAS